MEFGEKLKKIRKSNNLTQKELAKLSGIAEITIRKYENNERNPKIQQIEKITNVLNMDLENFLDNDSSLYQVLNEIKKLRKEHKMTQQELANKIGKTESSIRKYESGIVQIPINVLEKIAKIFNLQLIISFSNKFDLSKIPTSELLQEIERRCI